MTYVYLIESGYYQGHHYVGLTADLKQRFSHHNEGKSPHIRKFKPWNLVSYTAFADVIPIARTFYSIVIARCAKRAVAIQLDCFVVPQGGTPRNDSVFA